MVCGGVRGGVGRGGGVCPRGSGRGSRQGSGDPSEGGQKGV